MPLRGVPGTTQFQYDAAFIHKKCSKVAFPVHDMILHPQFAAFVPAMVGNLIRPHGIELRAIELNKEYEF